MPRPSLLAAYLQANEGIFIQHLPRLDELLASLQPLHHTLGITIILHHKSAAVPLSNRRALLLFMSQCRSLMLNCDSLQVQLVPVQFVAIVAKFCSAALSSHAFTWVLKPLMAAATALQPSYSQLTPIHPEVFKFVLLSKCHHTARMFLDDEIVEVNAGVTLATPRDMLLHHYYRGMCLLGLNRVASALACFTLCFSAPAVSLNAIQVEAYKRCLLCSLIMRGEGPTIPKYTAPCVVRHVKTYVPAYTELVSACSKPSIRVGLSNLLMRHAVVYERDGTLGLVKQCTTALATRCVGLLARTFMTLSLSQIAAHAALPAAAAAEAHLLKLVGSAEICARIDQPRATVHFVVRSVGHNTHAAVLAMQASLSSILCLNNRLSALQTQVQADRHYLSRIGMSERPSQWGEDEVMARPARERDLLTL